MSEPWLIDTDPGLGLPLADVDDALAIVHLHAWGVKIAGLTTVYGNAPLHATTRSARALGQRFGLPVFAGAARPGDHDTDAARALTAHTGNVLAIGPLTNIAAALDRGARWSRLVVLGGTDRRLPNLRPLHTTELNFAIDEAAAARCLPHIDLLCPMEPCRKVYFSRTELRGAPDWLRRGCQRWLLTSPLRTGRFAFHPWDLLPAAAITHPERARTRTASFRLNSRPGYRGYLRYGVGTTPVITAIDDLPELWAQSLARLDEARAVNAGER